MLNKRMKSVKVEKGTNGVTCRPMTCARRVVCRASFSKQDPLLLRVARGEGAMEKLCSLVRCSLSESTWNP